MISLLVNLPSYLSEKAESYYPDVKYAGSPKDQVPKKIEKAPPVRGKINIPSLRVSHKIINHIFTVEM